MNFVNKTILLSLFLFNIIVCMGSEPTKTLKIDSKIKSFELSQITLTDGPFKDAMERNTTYLKSFDMERLLTAFRKNAGLPTKAKEFLGTESVDKKNDGVRGIILGHYISALSKTFAVTGDKECKKRIDYLIGELSKCQKKAGNGYIGAFPETVFDEMNKGNQVVGNPWMSVQTILAGMYDSYNFAGNGEVYAMMMQYCDWIKKKTDGLSAEQMQSQLNVSYGDITETMANFYAITQNPNHLLLAKRFEHKSFVKDLSSETDNLTGLNATIQLEKIVGIARLYDVVDDYNYFKSCKFFWDCMVNHRITILGGVNETFMERDLFSKNLESNTINEISSTQQLLSLTNYLYKWNGESKYVDYYEHTLINSILASQSNLKYEKENAGCITQYQPISSGAWKQFGDKENTNWKNVGSGMESQAEYGKFIYSYDKEGLYINLFIGSKLTWAERKINITQESEFPAQESSKITFEVFKPSKFKIKIRVPSWTSNISIKLNGNPKKHTIVGSYAEMERVWESKDVIEISFPMILRTEPLFDNKNKVALMYGPMVLVGKLGNKGLTKNVLFADFDSKTNIKVAPIEIPSLKGIEKDITTCIKPIPKKPFTFETNGKGVPNDVVLEPYYRQFFERSVIYWDVK